MGIPKAHYRRESLPIMLASVSSIATAFFLLTVKVAASNSSIICGPSPIYAPDSISRFIPYANALRNTNLAYDVSLDFSITTSNSPQVYNMTASMDTGSTGVVIGAQQLGLGLKDLKKYQPGNEYLGSSGVFWEGYWLPASDVNLTFTAASVTAKVPILAVTETSICGKFSNGECEESSKTNITHWPTDTRYLGVGFGRWKAAQPDKTPDKVPLIKIAFVDGAPVAKGAMNAGYVINSTGVQVGLTSQNTQGFAKTKLDLNPESPAPRDWAQVTMSLAVDKSHWNDGHALFDTGIGYSFISVDAETTKQLQKTIVTDGKKNHSVLAPGSEVHMRVGTAPNFIAYYNVTAGDKHKNVGPNRGEFRTQAASVDAFLNTGRNFYRGFDAFFDSECGWFGLRWTGEDGDEHGGQYSAVF